MIDNSFIISSLKLLYNKSISDDSVKKELGKKIKYICEFYISKNNEFDNNEMLLIDLEEKIKMLNHLTNHILNTSNKIDYDHIDTLMDHSKYKSLYKSLIETIDFKNFDSVKFKEFLDKKIQIIKLSPQIDNMKNLVEHINNNESELDISDKFKDEIGNIYHQIFSDFFTNPKDEFSTHCTISGDNINKVLRTYGRKKLENKKIRSGLPHLDYCLNGGFEPGRIYIMGATPGLGKSITLLNFMFNALNNIKPNYINSPSDLNNGRTKFKKENYNVEIEECTNSIFIYFTLENKVMETLDRLFALYLNRSHRKTERINKFYNKILENISKIAKLYDLIDDNLNEDELNIFDIIDLYKKIFINIKRGNVKKIENISVVVYLNELFHSIFNDETINKYKITPNKILAGYASYYRVLEKLLLNKQKYNNIEEIIYKNPYNTSITDLSIEIDKIKEKYPNKKLKAIYVDYLDLMKSVNKTEQYRLELGYITTELKTLGNTYNVPIITATQLNSEGYNWDKSPKLSSITESKKKVEHADFIALLSQNKFDIKKYINKLKLKITLPNDDDLVFEEYDPKKFGYNFTNFDIQKNRSGMVKKITQLFDYTKMGLYDNGCFNTDLHETDNKKDIYDIISTIVKNKLNKDTSKDYLNTFDVLDENIEDKQILDKFYEWF